jgi:uncharacterized protein (TIGR03435 family)
MFRFAAPLLLASLLHGQRPQFEVASVKLLPRPTPGRPSFVVEPTRANIRMTSLAELIQRAYSVKWYQVDPRRAVDSHGRKADGPMPLYDIMATMPAGTSSSDFDLMLQSLLEERLKLKFHRENRQIPSYILTVVPGGPKLVKVSDPPEAQARLEFEQGGMRIHQQMSLEKLLAILRFEVGAGTPIIDQTGLEGAYDIDLRWPVAEAHGEVMPENVTSLQQAILRQLGLKMEFRKTTVETLVLDRFDREPTPN